ncbi:hypothetical protein HDU93_009310, partial [Gonapodya sp. JEL0774]
MSGPLQYNYIAAAASPGIVSQELINLQNAQNAQGVQKDLHRVQGGMVSPQDQSGGGGAKAEAQGS